jgi:hopanoid biosynthesis associated radical SAM protein HpnH
LAIPLAVTARVGAYIMKQQFSGVKRYPLVLMLEPLFRCNLACVGCGKIDYPGEILNQRLSVEQCMEAIDECGAPVVSVAGGEPLLHRDMPKIVEGFLARKKFVILCTNALLLTKKIDQYKPDPFFTWSIHLDGDQMMHDHSVCQDGVYDIAVKAIKLAKSKGFQCNLNCTLFQGADPERVAKFFDEMKAIGIDGVTVSPGYAYERAPDQDNFLNRTKTKQLFRDILKLGNGGKAWSFTQSTMFMDFLAGNQAYHCTPWGNPTRNVFGWQKPCYLLGEGYAKTFTELMETTDWDIYGTGKYEKCANCMAHCGYEPTAANAMTSHPLQAAMIGIFGVKTEGPMAPEIDMTQQRPAQYIFDGQVQQRLSEIRTNEAREKAAKEAARTSASAA